MVNQFRISGESVANQLRISVGRINSNQYANLVANQLESGEPVNQWQIILHLIPHRIRLFQTCFHSLA